MLQSCRNDHFPEQETYSNSSKFNLTSKTISLNESKHKSKLVSELNKAETELKNRKTDASGKIINYDNGVSIDTDHVIYIENGPNYHTYTFRINRENSPADTPVENLVLTPLPNGGHREFLVSYQFTQQEKQKMLSGYPVDTKGKTTITELVAGTYNGSGQLAKTVCGYVSETIWVACYTGDHNQSNWETWHECNWEAQGQSPPMVYTTFTYKCIEENDDTITPLEPGGSSGGGGGSGNTSGGGGATVPPCDTSIIPTNPESEFTDENGCPVGTPTLPNLGGNLQNDPCEKLQNQKADPNFTAKIDHLKNNLNLKKEIGYIEKNDGTYVYKDNATATETANSLTLGDPTPDMKGFSHIHPNDFEVEHSDGTIEIRKGFKIFSPADVIYFNQIVALAQQNGTSMDDKYAVMVSSTGTYQIRFTGNVNQIKTVYTNTKKQYNEMYIKYFQKNSKVSDELNFLKFIDEQMYVKGITLVKMNEDGTFTKKH
ncbi:hypothetical protein MUU74_07005 [Chryseobacterium daecheongense]|uniref:hypothetical protein n=1 Tax=Chryseobacterium daecheongense TaxID=192389 RepID=UPI001FD63435|nr:hypothetical protein [Chryseobacterium daecheongense]UOU99697.1 hypothetical protein MUU74_07005 [Chryseobacterium daecheongense]